MSDNKDLTDKEIEKKVAEDAIKNFYASKDKQKVENTAQPTDIPDNIKMPDLGANNFSSIEKQATIQNDPDLVITYEKVPLPSEGKYYNNHLKGLKYIEIEYLTSRDEDLLTTPSLIEDGSVIDKLLQRKIVTKNVDPSHLISGDRSALILFLRTSSYGNMYKVSVGDPRYENKNFEQEIDLTKLKYKKNEVYPDELGEFTVHIPMRDRDVKFKLLTSGEENSIIKNAEALKEAYDMEYTEFNTMRLKASITQIGDKRDRGYIEKFVDAMPAQDAYVIRRKILDVSPEVEMMYEFTATDGYKFKAPLSLGVDFFFPSH